MPDLLAILSNASTGSTLAGASDKLRAEGFVVHEGTTRNHVLGGSSRLIVLTEGEVTIGVVGYLRRFQSGRYEDLTLSEFIRLYRTATRGAFAQLGGHFAMVLIDSGRRVSYAVTDKFGTVPLYYSRCGGSVVIADSLAGVTRFSERSTLDSQAIFNYVYHQMIPSPRTVFKDTLKLGPAQILTANATELKVDTYWTPTFVGRTSANERDLAAKLQSLLQESVTRADSGVSTACFLSGGIDSSTVCGMAARGKSTPTRAYSVGFAIPDYDEMEYARITARRFGLELREYYLKAEELLELMPAMAAAYDEPFGNSSAVAVLALARQAKKDGVDLLLAGDGGDEIFGGNDRYAKQKVFEAYYSVPGSLRKHLIEPLVASRAWPSAITPLRKIKSYIEQAKIPMPARLETYNFLEMTPSTEVFEPDFLAAVDIELPKREIAARYAESGGAELVDRMLYLDWKVTLADNDLRKVTQMCATGGVRVAYPFLDDDLLQFSLGLPAAFKVRGLRLRDFYKKAMTNFLPPETIAKTKHGFSLPFGLWLTQSKALADLSYSSLDSLKQRRIFRRDFIDGLVERHRSSDASHYGKLIWVMAMLELWLAAHAG